MKMVKGNHKFSVVVLLVLLSLVCFVFAALDNAPAGLTFTNNASPMYDEGNFSFNWTHDVSTGDGVANYTIFIYADGVLYNYAATNNSDLGYSFNNWTEANYTFFITATNVTVVNYTVGGGTINATSNISMTVDRTAPVIGVTTYVNGTSKKNTQDITINVSVSDASSGLTGSVCLVNVGGGANTSLAVSSGWCNSTNINLTGLAEGNQTLSVYVNDTIGNLGLNNSFVVNVDTTAPNVSFSCSPQTATQNGLTTCSCSGADTISGFNSSSLSYTSSPSTADTGTYSITCTGSDNAGNLGAGSATYYVQGVASSGSPGGGGSALSSFWTGTRLISDEAFKEGTNLKLAAKKRARFNVNGKAHYIGVIELTSTKAVINISSNPVQAELEVGEDAKIDVTSDGYYDVLLVLRSIDGSEANVSLSSIHEVVPAEEDENGVINKDGEANNGDGGESYLGS